MTTKNIKSLLLAGLVSCGLATGLTSCKSGDQDFPDFDYQSCYFAKQYPVRTIELGNDLYVDLTNDNQHKFEIQAVMGGAYSNPRDININIVVDPSLCDGVTFADGTPVAVMPESYYKLAAQKIVIPSGKPVGGVEVQLTDDFFADPLATTTHYVIPVRMDDVTGVDTVLAAKKFTLYAVKYVNRYHAQYILNGNLYGASVDVTTKDLNTSLFTYAAKDADGRAYNGELQLNFAADGTCTVTSNAEGFVIQGTGRFVEADETQLVGARHPDTMYLDFSGTYDGFRPDLDEKGNPKEDENGNPIMIPVHIDINEKYVMTVKTRGVKSENFK